MAKFPLQKVNRLPDVCFSVWRLSGEEIEEHPISLAAYKALAAQGAGAPSNPTGDSGAVWLSAFARPVFDTPSGLLVPGDVCEWNHGADYCNGPSDITLRIGTSGKTLNVREVDIRAGSKNAVSELTVDNQRPGIAVVNGELIEE